MGINNCEMLVAKLFVESRKASELSGAADEAQGSVGDAGPYQGLYWAMFGEPFLGVRPWGYL